MKGSAWFPLAVAGWLACSGIAHAAEHALGDISEHEVQQLSVRAQMEKMRRVILLQHAGLALYLDNLISRLWTHVDSDRPMARVYVVEDAVAGAHTFPDGAIYLTTGMMAHTQNEDQLAMILSHEIIHYKRRHALAALNHSRSTAPLNPGEIRQDLAMFLHAAEQEADREGLVLMQQAGFCAQTAVSRVDASGDGRTKGVVAFNQRLAQVKRALDQMPAGDADRNCQNRVPEYDFYIAPALLANARSATRQGAWEQASESIQRYIAIRADDPQAYYLQGDIAYRSGKRSDLTISSFQKAIDLDRSFIPAYRALGFMHFKAGRLQDARSYFETSLALAPHADENDYIRGYLQLCSE